jgi:hypothetical protein
MIDYLRMSHLHSTLGEIMGKILATLWMFLRFELKQLPLDLSLILALFRERMVIEVVVESPLSPLDHFLLCDFPRRYGTLHSGEKELQPKAV